MMFRCFTRTWWKENADWPNGLEPAPGAKRYKGTFSTEQEAREFCQDWNSRHKPGRLSLKCEFEAI